MGSAASASNESKQAPNIEEKEQPTPVAAGGAAGAAAFLDPTFVASCFRDYPG